MADGNWGLTAYNAVPVNGVLTPIIFPTSAATGGINKYQRVVFGDGRVYTTKASALIMLSGGGQTQSAPVTCSPNPVAFGSVTVANTETMQVTCTANTAVTNPSCNTSSAIYQCGSSTIPSTVASGGSFTFPVVSSYPYVPLKASVLMFSLTDIQFERCKYFAIPRGYFEAGSTWYFSGVPSSVCLCGFCIPSRHCSSAFRNRCRPGRIFDHQSDLSVLWRSLYRRQTTFSSLVIYHFDQRRQFHINFPRLCLAGLLRQWYAVQQRYFIGCRKWLHLAEFPCCGFHFGCRCFFKYTTGLPAELARNFCVVSHILE